MKILSFGEVLWDVYPDEAYIGGAPLNFAAHLAMHGESAYMLSAVGDDDLGKRTLEKISELGVSTKYVSVLHGSPTGKCVVTLNEDRVPKYDLLSNVAYDRIDTACVEEPFDVLYFGTLSLREENNRVSLGELIKRDVFNEIFADVNIRPPFYSDESILLAVSTASILKISDEELGIVAKSLGITQTDVGGFARAIAERFDNLGCIIITRGGDGAYAYDCKTASEYFCDSVKVDVLSTVGAGDSFSAAFLHKYLRSVPIYDCLRYASAVAGFVCSNYDAIPTYDISAFEGV